MITKPCLWCGLNMRVKTNEQWRSLHKECYKKHYVPVSKKYSFKYFEQNIDQMKSNEKESLARCRQILADISLDDIKD